MSEQSRRTFLTRASIGAAVAGVAVVAPSVTSSADADPLAAGPAHDGSFTVWVKDAKAGQIAVMVGESEVVYQDRALATRLARLAARAKS
jgi:hypothetical protein